jgi:uncharacterized HAD superfamily protein
VFKKAGVAVRFGIDVDGVLANWDKGFEKIVPYFPEKLSHEAERAIAQPATDWDYKPRIVGTNNWKWFWKDGALNFRTYENLPAYPGQLEALGQLPGETYLITSLPVRLRAHRFAWLAKNHVVVDGVFFTNTPEEKVEVINALGIEHFVDDRIETLTGLVGNTPAQLYVYDRPWNRDGNVHASITRIKSLRELL